MSEILINVRPNLTRVALLEKGELVDFKIEKRNIPTLVGSIYKGKVVRVLPGMQAAFVDIGESRTAFLYVGDVYVENKEDFLFGYFHEGKEDTDLDSRADSTASQIKMPIQDLISEGQMLLVQVLKDPLGTKGARITTLISLPGRHLVYMPKIKNFGVSRKIVDEQERDRLRKLYESIQPNGGVIIRTAGEKASEEDFRQDISSMEKVWSKILEDFKEREELGLIYSDVDIELRTLRDLLSERIERVLVDSQEVYNRIKHFLYQFLPQYENKITLYSDPQPLFDLYDLDLEISRALERKVWLKSGGYIVIDEAEALVVIDVNTGKFVGKKDLDETILKTNLEAVKEIAYQVKIRNCGGIIIIDFIDMEKVQHQERVLNALKEELLKDRARTEITQMTSLGLVEMTRKRIRPSLVSTLCEPCHYCEGKGYLKRQSTVANDIFRDLERESGRLLTQKEIVVFCHKKVVDWIYEEESATLDFVERKLGKVISFVVNPQFLEEEYEVTSAY